MNRLDVLLHMNEPDPISVQSLFGAGSCPPLCNPNLISIRLGDMTILASPEAATELASQLNAHLAGLARRDKEATA